MEKIVLKQNETVIVYLFDEKAFAKVKFCVQNGKTVAFITDLIIFPGYAGMGFGTKMEEAIHLEIYNRNAEICGVSEDVSLPYQGAFQVKKSKNLKRKDND